MLEKSINTSFEFARKRQWDRVYWAIDLHGVIVKPTYDNTKPDTFYEDSLRVLKMLSKRQDICLILFSCSYEPTIEKYLTLFRDLGILFTYVNSNPEVTDNEYSCYKDKFYYNILLDDKAGFDPETDWLIIEKCLEKNKCLVK